MSTITLILTASSVTVADGRASLTASVTNRAPVPARIVLGAFGPPDAPTTPGASAWASIDKPLREIAAGATEQFTVTFAPPAGTAAGNYPVRFIAYSADQAPEEHADQAKQVDVVVPATAPPPPPKKPRWPYAVGAGLVLVGAVVWFLLPIIFPPQPVPPPSTPASLPPEIQVPSDLQVAQPDLVITGATVTNEQGALAVNVTVENTGTMTATSVDGTCSYACPLSGFSATDWPFLQGGYLVPGKSVTGLLFVSPSCGQDTLVRFDCVIDPDNEFTEEDELNNTWSGELTIR